MKRRHLRFGRGLRVVLENARAQAATMTISPSDAEGGPTNRHRGADQWLFVLSGTGSGRVNGTRYGRKAGTLVLIERKDRHEIKCTGRKALRTLNFYLPPAYSKDGEELPPAKP
jgi:mannose-6-phosphate isomerase-like protein (cupin superfamily)